MRCCKPRALNGEWAKQSYSSCFEQLLNRRDGLDHLFTGIIHVRGAGYRAFLMYRTGTIPCLPRIDMLDKLKGIEDRYEQLGNELLEVGNNYQRAA